MLRPDVSKAAVVKNVYEFPLTGFTLGKMSVQILVYVQCHEFLLLLNKCSVKHSHIHPHIHLQTPLHIHIN